MGSEARWPVAPSSVQFMKWRFLLIGRSHCSLFIYAYTSRTPLYFFSHSYRICVGVANIIEKLLRDFLWLGIGIQGGTIWLDTVLSMANGGKPKNLPWGHGGCHIEPWQPWSKNKIFDNTLQKLNEKELIVIIIRLQASN